MMASLSFAAIEVLFDFDSARIPEGTSDRLAEIVEWAEENPDGKVVIDGNADNTGPSEYNVTLSLRRAKTVQAQLKMLGVDEDRMYIVGYGENGMRRTDALDRNVTVWTTEEPLFAVIDRSMDRATTVLWRAPVMAAQIDGPQPTQTAFR